MPDIFTVGDATFSECGAYRYRLSRIWNPALPLCTFIMLNPSTAGALADDTTITRCIGFSMEFGCGGLIVVNLFAFRATNPKDMFGVADPIGPGNDAAIADAAKTDGPVICAWGANGWHMGRDQQVLALLEARGTRPMSLKVTKDGFPGHPLYLPYGITPRTYTVA